MSVSDPTLSRKRTPLLGPAIAALREGKPQAIYILLAVFLTLVTMAVMTWGLVALSMIALALVPVIMVTLVLITVGK